MTCSVLFQDLSEVSHMCVYVSVYLEPEKVASMTEKNKQTKIQNKQKKITVDMCS